MLTDLHLMPVVCLKQKVNTLYIKTVSYLIDFNAYYTFEMCSRILNIGIGILKLCEQICTVTSDDDDGNSNDNNDDLPIVTTPMQIMISY